MMLFNEIIIKDFEPLKDEWLLIYNDTHYIVNGETKFIINEIKKYKSITKSLPSFNKKYNSNIKLDDYKKLIKLLFQKFDIPLKGNETFNKKKSYIKNKVQLLNPKMSKIFAKILNPLFEKRIFYISLLFLFVTNLILLRLFNAISFQEKIPEFISIILIILPGIILHELGHVSACEKFQVKNGGIGIGRYIIFPVFYSDVTRIWTLNKNERIIVNLAGVFMQLIYITLLIILYIIFENKVFLTASALLFIDSLFQLLPFIRSDGYWVFSDFTGIYNLKKKSRDTIFGFLNHKKVSKSNKTLILIIYGLIDYGLVFFYIYTLIFKNWTQFINFPNKFFQILLEFSELNFKTIDISLAFLTYCFLYLFIFSSILNFLSMEFSKRRKSWNVGIQVLVLFFLLPASFKTISLWI